MRRLVAAGVLGAALLAAAPASAEPVALRDAPRAEDVALAGDEVVIARTTARGGLRVIAIPRTGGAARTLLAVPPLPADAQPDVQLSASSGVVAAIVTYEAGGEELRLYSGPPSGPLALRRSVRAARGRWLPLGIDADADRLLLEELRLQNGFSTRARVLVPGAPAELVAWDGPMFAPVLAGERIAFAGAPRQGSRRAGLYVIARRTGAVEAFARARPEEDVEEGGVDLAGDGRAVAALDGRLLTVAPGVAPARFGSGLSRPRFSGAGFAALRERPLDVRTPVIAEDGGIRAIGSPSGGLELFEADDRGAAWIANGCVLYAPRESAPPAEPPAGPCPRAEVVLGEGDQVLRGRRLRVIVRCVAAPAPGCRGTVLLGRGRYGRGPFAVPAGTRRTVEVRLTDRALRLVRHRSRDRFGGPFFGLSARVRDGRAHGISGIVVDRVRR